MDLYINKEDICLILNNMCDDILFKPNSYGFKSLNTTKEFRVENKIPINTRVHRICNAGTFSIYF